MKINTPYPEDSIRLGDLDNSTNNVLIPLDSWTSGLLVYRLPLSELLEYMDVHENDASESSQPSWGKIVPTAVNMVCSMWLFKHKFHANGMLSRYKAWLVANGSSQQHGIDWPIHKLDVKNAFLNGDLSETVYMHQPLGFMDPRLRHTVVYLLIYVDDIILTTSSLALLQQIIDSLHKEFDMNDLEALNYFLDIFADRTSTSLFLSHKKYALQILKRTHMVHGNHSWTPVYLYIHDLREPHFAALKRILRYVRGTVEFGLQLYASATTFLVGYINADWAGFPSIRSSEAEYRGVPNVVAETAWLRNLLCELHSSLSTATLVYCDNVSDVYMSANLVQHQRTKHIEIDIHFIRDMVTISQV
ncbi:ribonuclease H-like domain-containing protein [Tanacetum coccineum]|uniref:Ribonuclease H-like domain-containing protein n=1 Tax=Tanacetum coccineum TaxID=301880 RepID=A0ABQ4X5Y8_9ASTR